MRLLKDSKGNPSWHVTLAVPALIAASVWFLTGGLDLTIGKFHLVLPLRNGSDYLAFAGVWLTALGFRDFTNAKFKSNEIEVSNASPTP